MVLKEETRRPERWGWGGVSLVDGGVFSDGADGSLGGWPGGG